MTEWNSLPKTRKVGRPFLVSEDFLWSTVTLPNSTNYLVIKIAKTKKANDKLVLEIELMEILKEYSRQVTGTWILRCTKFAATQLALCKAITWKLDCNSVLFRDYFMKFWTENNLLPPGPDRMIQLLEQCLLGLNYVHSSGVWLRVMDSLSIELYGLNLEKIRFINFDSAYRERPILYYLSPEMGAMKNESLWKKANQEIQYTTVGQVAPSMAKRLLSDEQNRIPLSINLHRDQDYFCLGSVFYFAVTMMTPYYPMLEPTAPTTASNLAKIAFQYKGIEQASYPYSILFDNILSGLLDPIISHDLPYYIGLIQARAKNL